MSAAESDSLIREIREQISDIDRSLVDAFNKRLELVQRLWRHKQSRGVEMIDPEREKRMLKDLAQANRGPLSQDGLEELFAEILDLTKREVRRAGDAG